MESHVLLISAQASAGDVDATAHALVSTQLPFSGPHPARQRRLPREAAAAVLVGPEMDVPLVDALRHLTSNGIPTLVLVRGLTEQQETGLLGLGAHDVLGLPSSAARLTSRISALHRNRTPRIAPTGAPEETIAVSREVVLWPERRQLLVNGAVIATTKSEFDLLMVLARHPGRVVSRSQLLTEMSNGAPGPASLESHISRIRRKVMDQGGPRLIESIRGVGYHLSDSGPAAGPRRAAGD
ncbi:winged helix-turn-helix transcriptional regulator [Serinicoccus hydrothermalis]|uniref:winged helix-turn-helix transcriptional regulator n=1 Tax=Serinicoccus hydrothermalis TaxID=1758689 RepID=UPI00082FCEC1|nr:response regulator transcription factor [Serinicoccus hydrothermalis]